MKKDFWRRALIVSVILFVLDNILSFALLMQIYGLTTQARTDAERQLSGISHLTQLNRYVAIALLVIVVICLIAYLLTKTESNTNKDSFNE